MDQSGKRLKIDYEPVIIWLDHFPKADPARLNNEAVGRRRPRAYVEQNFLRDVGTDEPGRDGMGV